MFEIITKSAKLKPKEKKKVKKYWQLLYGPDYAELMTAANKDNIHIASEKQEVEFIGKLKRANDGFVYVDVSNDIMNGLYRMLDEDGATQPPYRQKKNNEVGAHITVMNDDETFDKAKSVKEINSDIKFKIKGVFSIEPAGWDKVSRIWAIEVESPQLEDLRRKYGLTDKPNGHEFHITFAIRKKK